MLICAALLVQVEDFETPITLPCRRHGEGFQILRELTLNKVKTKVLKEGFIDHEGKFLDRYEALEHAKLCGQLTQSTLWYKEDNRENELYSEDLY